ncbi:MAG: hypothetical protein C4567_02400, partial [Deltaproteobacteria bacterium]
MRRVVLGAGITAGLALAVAVAFFFRPQGSETPQPRPEAAASPSSREQGYAGTGSCRECHEKFYQLWAPSHHGLAMQAVTPEFLQSQLKPQENPIIIKDRRYLFVFRDGKGLVLEQGPGPEQTYPMVQALGGKNVYYFLTPLEKGRLQVLPLAYDVR